MTILLHWLGAEATAQESRVLPVSTWAFWSSATGHPAAFEQGTCTDEPVPTPDPRCASAADVAASQRNLVTRKVALGKGVVADLIACGDRSLLLDTVVDLPAGRGTADVHVRRLAEVLAASSGVGVDTSDVRSAREPFRIPAFHGPAREFLVQAINPRSSEWVRTYAVREDGLGGWRIGYTEVTFLVLPEEIRNWAMQSDERSTHDVPHPVLLFGRFADDEREKRRCGTALDE